MAKLYGRERIEAIIEYGKTKGINLDFDLNNYKDYQSYSVFRFMGYSKNSFKDRAKANGYEELYQLEVDYINENEPDYFKYM